MLLVVKTVSLCLPLISCVRIYFLFVNSSQLSSHLVVYTLCKVGNRQGGLFAASLLTHGTVPSAASFSPTTTM